MDFLISKSRATTAAFETPRTLEPLAPLEASKHRSTLISNRRHAQERCFLVSAPENSAERTLDEGGLGYSNLKG